MGDHFHIDMPLSAANNTLYIIELSFGFETNVDDNANREDKRYHSLRHELSSKYHKVKFVNISISSLGIFGNSCDIFIQMYNNHDYSPYFIYC